jgi:hypothetical protein
LRSPTAVTVAAAAAAIDDEEFEDEAEEEEDDDNNACPGTGRVACSGHTRHTELKREPGGTQFV